MYIDKRGEDLVEVLSVSVVIDEIDDLRLANIKGTFQVSDIADEPIECYRGGVEGSPSLLPDGTLSLSGPIRSLLGPDWNFKIYLEEMTRNLEICNGNHYMGVSYPRHVVNRPLSVFVRGKDGYAIVNYILFKKAAQATIEVWIDIDDDKGCIPAIHGSIWAKFYVCECDNAYDEQYCRVTLFNVSEEKAVKLKNGKNKIPLLRSTGAVPIGTDLVIVPELFQGSCDLLRNCYALFEANASGTTCMSTDGITFKVSWDFDPFRAAGLNHPFEAGVGK